MEEAILGPDSLDVFLLGVLKGLDGLHAYKRALLF